MAEAKVKTKLELDDAASELLDKIADGFEEVAEEQKAAQSGFSDFMRQAAATAAGMDFMHMVGKVGDMATSFFDVASAAHDSQQAIAGMLSGVQGLEWTQARREAEKYHQEVVDLSISLGQASDDMLPAFNRLMTYMGGTADASRIARQEIGHIGTVANVLGLSAQTIGSEFAQMASGQVRLRGELFSLLRSTGIFHDDVSKISTEWMKLTDTERINRLQGAMETVAGNLGKAAPTFSDLVTSMKEIGRETLETMGEPVLNELIPVFEEFREIFLGSRREIERFARSLGRDVGRWLVEMSENIESGFEWIRTHQEEIKDAIVEAFTFAKDVVQFIIENKEVLAAAFGAQMTKPVIGAAASGVSAVAKSGYAAAGGAGLVGAAGAAGAVAALAAAIGALMAAADQGAKLIDETAGAVDPMTWRFWSSSFEELWQDTDAAFNRKAKVEAAERAAMQGNVEMIREMTSHLSGMGSEGEAAAKRLGILEQETIAATFEAQAAIRDAAARHDVDELVDAYNEAAETGNRSVQAYAAQMLDSSADLRRQMEEAGHELIGGGEEFARMLRESTNEMVEAIGETSTVYSESLMRHIRALGTPEKEKIDKPESPRIAMHGGQTFKIQQDFRNEDPDRIAILFQRDIAAAAERRVQATTSSPFGT